jgi:hypothetical protein
MASAHFRRLRDLSPIDTSVTVAGKTYAVRIPAPGFLEVKGHGAWRSEPIGELDPDSPTELRARVAAIARHARAVTEDAAATIAGNQVPDEPWERGE